MEAEDLDNHIVVLGWDQFSHGLVEQLVAANNQVAVVVTEAESKAAIEEAFGEQKLHVTLSPLMDFTCLEKARIPKARKVFVNLASDHDSLVAVLSLQAEFGEDLGIDVVVEQENLQDTFYVAGANYAVSPGALASNVIASQIYEEDVGELSDELLYATEGRNDCEFQQYQVTEANRFCGETYGTLFWALKEELNCVALGLSKSTDEGHDLYEMPDPDLRVEQGDYVVVIAHGSNEPELVEIFGVGEGIAHDA